MNTKKQILVATHNAHKAQEFRDMLGAEYQVLALSDLPLLASSARKIEIERIQAVWKREDAEFEVQIDRAMAGEVGRGETLRLGATPAVFRAVGASNLHLTMSLSTFQKVTGNRRHNPHFLTGQQVKQLPAQLRAPVAVFKSDTERDALVVLTELIEAGKPVIAAITLNARDGRMLVNRIASVYGKDRTEVFRLWMSKGLMLYADKKRIRNLASTGLQSPGEVDHGFWSNVITPNRVVNHPGSLSRELSGPVPPEESGVTFEENARIKAVAACEGFDGWVLADDSGLEVDALNGEPGVHSARYSGENATDATNRAKLREALEGIQKRSARFRCVIAIARRGEVLAVFSGAVEGSIGTEERGSSGFGYDPLFHPDGHEETFAELSSEAKHALSHRGRAAAQAIAWLKNAD